MGATAPHMPLPAGLLSTGQSASGGGSRRRDSGSELVRRLPLGSLRTLRARIDFGLFRFEDRYFIRLAIQQRFKKPRITPFGREKRTVRPRPTTPLKAPPRWDRLVNYVEEARELGLGIFRVVIINDKIPRKPRTENDAIHHIASTAHEVQIV